MTSCSQPAPWGARFGAFPRETPKRATETCRHPAWRPPFKLHHTNIVPKSCTLTVWAQQTDPGSSLSLSCLLRDAFRNVNLQEKPQSPAERITDRDSSLSCWPYTSNGAAHEMAPDLGICTTWRQSLLWELMEVLISDPKASNGKRNSCNIASSLLYWLLHTSAAAAKETSFQE